VLLPPLSTVSGKLLVAYLQPKEQEQYLEADPAYAGAPESERDAIRAELKAIRRAGFYMAPSKKLRTVTDVSSYVGNPAVGVSAALCVPFIAGHINDGKERKLVPRIRDCSDQITKALGLSSER
jgi:DNA-binding IclR family transcriptional regulator